MSVPRRMRLVSVFVSVVEAGGFRAAGRKLALSPAQVSQAVKDLEADLGVALLYRSTRRLQLTRAAEDSLPYFPRDGGAIRGRSGGAQLPKPERDPHLGPHRARHPGPCRRPVGLAGAKL